MQKIIFQRSIFYTGYLIYFHNLRLFRVTPLSLLLVFHYIIYWIETQYCHIFVIHVIFLYTVTHGFPRKCPLWKHLIFAPFSIMGQFYLVSGLTLFLCSTSCIKFKFFLQNNLDDLVAIHWNRHVFITSVLQENYIWNINLFWWYSTIRMLICITCFKSPQHNRNY